MKEIIDKISTYNIFNYLFPGIIYVLFLREITAYDLVQNNIVLGAFLYYFIGLVISRIGSLVIEKILRSKKLKFAEFVNYSDFVSACDKDDKIEVFSEINNMYRTLISTLIILLFAKIYELLEGALNIPVTISYIFLIILLIVIFLFSYQKQTNFIVKRVTISKNKNKENV